MTKEQIYEHYWKKLVEIRRVYIGFRPDGDSLLKEHGYEPFVA